MVNEREEVVKKPKVNARDEVYERDMEEVL
jgi:hypothetical protein